MIQQGSNTVKGWYLIKEQQQLWEQWMRWGGASVVERDPGRSKDNMKMMARRIIQEDHSEKQLKQNSEKKK